MMKRISSMSTVLLFGWLMAMTTNKLDEQQAVVYTKDIKNITNSSAVCPFTVTSNSTTLTQGVCVNKLGNPTITDGRIYKGTMVGKPTGPLKEYTATITGCKPASALHVRAYVQFSNGTVIYGNEKTFTTAVK